MTVLVTASDSYRADGSSNVDRAIRLSTAAAVIAVAGIVVALLFRDPAAHASLDNPQAAPPCGRTALLRRRPEQQPAQRRHALLQPGHLPSQLGHPRGQPGVLRPQLRHQRLGPPGAGTPVTGLNILIDHRRRHATQHTSPHEPRHAPNLACRDPRRAPAPRDHRLLTF